MESAHTGQDRRVVERFTFLGILSHGPADLELVEISLIAVSDLEVFDTGLIEREKRLTGLLSRLEIFDRDVIAAHDLRLCRSQFGDIERGTGLNLDLSVIFGNVDGKEHESNNGCKSHVEPLNFEMRLIARIVYRLVIGGEVFILRAYI